jgi:glycosyltransferase involved in cell wall biosynthesis
MNTEKSLPRLRLLFLVTEDWYFWTHRRSIALAAQAKGFHVTIATHVQNHGALIEQAGFKLIPIRLRRRSFNPIKELFVLAELIAIYRRERPSIVHHVAIKPVLYGSWAAVLSGVNGIVNALAGLGHVFVSHGWRASAFRWFMRLAFFSAFRSKRVRVIFQNPEDQRIFVNAGVIAPGKSVLIRGMGVDLGEFSFRPEPKGISVVMLAGRLLWNKGVGELVKAGKMLISDDFICRIVLVGAPDPENPRSVSEITLRNWQRAGVAEWWGRREDMPDVLEQANLVVLPTTYGEGVPKILLEAAAIGRAIIATDIPGCREIVRHGENGFLIPPGDVSALAFAITELLKDPEQRARMGKRGREIVEAEFSQEQVVAETFATYCELLGERRQRSFRTHAKS